MNEVRRENWKKIERRLADVMEKYLADQDRGRKILVKLTEK